MESSEANSQMKARADQIARLVTEMHPLTPKLRNAEAQNEILRALFELTRQVEIVKKQLLRAAKKDDSTLL
jgi:hypothetical protein